MKIGLIYAMTGEIESLLTKENAEPLQTVAGVSFYRIRPDVIACIGGRFFAFEVKTEEGKATALQESVLRKIQKCGGNAAIVRSVEEVKRMLEEITA